MQIEITDTLSTETGFYITVTGPKKSAFVGITEHGVQVICQNAAHATFRGAGKRFGNKAEALDGYKSGEMKALIEAAFDAIPESFRTQKFFWKVS